MNFCRYPCSGRTLGKLVQPAIMTVLAKQSLHGYRIAERVARMHVCRGRKPDMTGVYRLLRSMEKRALVRASWDRSSAGPPRRVYELTAEGRACLGHWVGALEDYRQAIDELLDAGREAARRRTRRPAKTPPRASGAMRRRSERKQ